MADSFIQSPDDSANAGKKRRTNTRTVGADTVHESYTLHVGPGGGVGEVIATTPAGTEAGVVTRNIPSGTQAVSGPLTDTQLRATPVPVSGTVDLGSTSLSALETITVGGAVELGSTSLAALESITVGGTVELGSTSLAALESITATGPLTDTQLRASAVPVAPAAGTNRIGSVRLVDSADADLTTTKGTQPAGRVVAVQDLKDSGRTAVRLFATGAAAGTTGTETIIQLTRSNGVNTSAAANQYVIPSGKKLRITSISFASRGHATATAQVTTFSLRYAALGTLTTTSAQLTSARTATPATASAWDRFTPPLAEGDEIDGNGTAAIGVTANAVFVTNAPTWDVWIEGFEY